MLLGVVLCAVSVLGLTGAFGEISSAGKLDTIVLLGVPLGLVSIGAGVVHAFRGGRVPRDGDRDAPAEPGERADLQRPGGTDPAPTRPDGMIDR
ncbi:hypothetical protein ACMA46_12515 [Clavibacter sp. Sh2141]|uniref:hypothetical protein n=1 Tax=Clavibacter sp. Sh2141 TaxID=3395374 RepID=UPI0039BD6ACB